MEIKLFAQEAGRFLEERCSGSSKEALVHSQLGENRDAVETNDRENHYSESRIETNWLTNWHSSSEGTVPITHGL